MGRYGVGQGVRVVLYDRFVNMWAARVSDIDSLVTRRYPLTDINRAYEDIETDAVGRGVLVS